jgi:hypothetical protein
VHRPQPLRLFELIHALAPLPTGAVHTDPPTPDPTYNRIRLAVNHVLIADTSPVDKNKKETYKNVPETTEVSMLSFLKDALAFITIAGFSVASLSWMDIAARLV